MVGCFSLHPLQHPNRHSLLLLAYMAISIHRKPNIAMASQGLSRLGRNVRTAEVGDKGVPHGVEAVNCFGPAGEGELGREVGLVVVVPVGEKDVNKAVSC